MSGILNGIDDRSLESRRPIRIIAARFDKATLKVRGRQPSGAATAASGSTSRAAACSSAS